MIPAPYDCEHRGSYLLASTRSSGGPPPHRTSAFVCPHCGTFTVWIDGLGINFYLTRDEHLIAAGKYIEHLKSTEEPAPVVAGREGLALINR